MLKKIISKDMQQAMLIGAVVFLLLLFLGGRAMYKNSLVRVTKYNKDIRRVKLENQVGKQLADLKKMREGMPVISESSRFLAEIAKMAGGINLKLKSISAAPVQKFNEYVQLGVLMTLDTNYNELGIFVAMLENSQLLINVDKLEIKTPSFDKDEKGPQKIEAKLTVSTISLTDTILEK